jgi:hypothetical protein
MDPSECFVTFMSVPDTGTLILGSTYSTLFGVEPSI